MRQACLWGSGVPCQSAGPRASPHRRAIERIALEIKADEGLLGQLHNGMALRHLVLLLACGQPFSVEIEKTIRISGRRFVPDLSVRCVFTERPLLAIEVWHSHAVGIKKKAAYATAGIDWVEVRSWQTLGRFRKQSLAVLDWGGPGLPPGPEQFAFELE